MPSDYEIVDGDLVINDCQSNDGGRYVCTGTDTEGQVVLRVEARLEIVGSKLNFMCEQSKDVCFKNV